MDENVYLKMLRDNIQCIVFFSLCVFVFDSKSIENNYQTVERLKNIPFPKI